MLETLLIFSLIFFQDAGPGLVELTLKEAKIMALQNNRDIQIQEQNVISSEAEVLTNEGEFDPVLDFSTSYTDSQIPTVSTFIESGSIDEEILGMQAGVSGQLPTGTFYEVFNFSVERTETNSPIESLSPNLAADLSFSVGQDLLRNFGSDINKTFIRVAKANTDISFEEYKRVVSNVLLDVERDYWLLVSAMQNLDLAEKALELALDLKKRNEVQVEVGVLPPVSITQAESEVAARRVDLISAENRLERAEDRLKNRLVLSLESELIPVDQPGTYETDFNVKKLIDDAYNKRPEVEQAKKEIAKSERLKKYYSNQKLPRLSIEGVVDFRGIGGDANPNRLVFNDPPPPIPEQFDQQSDAFRNLFEGEFPTWTVLGTLSYPIFNRKARGQYIKADADLNRSVIELKRVKEQIELEVRNALRVVVNSKRGVDAALVSVDLAEQVLRNENEKLSVGLSTTRDILEAQRDLIDARTRKINAITEFNIAIAELQDARGTILENNNVELERDKFNYRNNY